MKITDMKITDMKITENNPGISYTIPTFEINENGLNEIGQLNIDFVKGSKDDESIFRQNGVIHQNLLEVCLAYLESVNVGNLKSEFGDKQIFHLQECLRMIEKRKQQRLNSGTLFTYKK